MKSERSYFRLMSIVALVIFAILSLLSSGVKAQPSPSADENIPFLVTFAGESSKSWGDDDFCQIYFFVVPKANEEPFYIRIFDPETIGQHDEGKGAWNSETSFEIYGGPGAITGGSSQKKNPDGKMRTGIRLAKKTFGADAQYDNKWYTFGPFNPVEGEYNEDYGGMVFKIIAQGKTGDDGNLYRYYFSSSEDQNIPVEGGNSFTFEYTFRLHNENMTTAHIYPFVDSKVTAVKINTYDFDNDGQLRLVSVEKNGMKIGNTGDDEWGETEFDIGQDEWNTSLDIQIIKTGNAQNNNMVFYIENQYGELMPFYNTPIGGVPKFKYKIGVKFN